MVHGISSRREFSRSECVLRNAKVSDMMMKDPKFIDCKREGSDRHDLKRGKYPSVEPDADQKPHSLG